jgi:hypothetical protein
MKKMIPTIYLISLLQTSVLDALIDIIDNKFTTDIYSYDLSNGCIDWNFDKSNKLLYTEIKTFNKEAKN